MKNIFVLERKKRAEGLKKLMITDQNLPRSYFHYVVRVVSNSSYFFLRCGTLRLRFLDQFLFSLQTSPELASVTLTKIGRGLDESSSEESSINEVCQFPLVLVGISL